MRFGLCGPGYTSQSIIADCQRLVNRRLEAIESGQGKSAFALYPEMGTKRFAALPDKPVRGVKEINGRTFAVGGSVLCEITGGVVTPLGAVANDGKMASLTASNIELLVAAGAHGYVYNLTSGLFTADPASLVSPRMVGYIKGFFVSLQDNSNTFQCSNALDGLTWDPTQKASVSDFPDNITSLIVDHNELWLCGNKRAEGWYFSGDVFPFAAIPQAFIEMGTGTAFSPTRLDNSVLWWGQNEDGAGMAWRAEGYTPKRISNHAIEYMVQGFGDISGAVSYGLQDNGHTLWRTLFPAANSGRGAMLQYDIATGGWSEIMYWDAAHGQENAHKSQCHCYSNGKHLVGDWTSGNVYEMASPKVSGSAWDFVTDDGNPIRRIRRAPVLAMEDERMFFDKIVFDLEAGLGPIPALDDGTGLQGVTAINTIGGSTLAKYRVRIATSSTVGHTYTITGTFLNIGANPITIGIGDSGNNFLASTTLQPNVLTNVSVSFVAAGGQLNYLIAAQSITDMVSLLGVNPTAKDITAAGADIMAANGSNNFQTLWSGQSGTAVTILQNQIIPGKPRGPLLMLRWSDDGGKTWSNERQLDCGQAGEFKKRIVVNKVGSTRKGRVFEISDSDPCPIRIIDAYINDPVERLTSKLRAQA